MLTDRPPGQTPAAVWTADASATVELDRLTSPAHGRIDPPFHLLVAGPVNLDDLPSKVALYQACLLRGGPFDMYQWINLGELLRLWHLLDLPAGIAACWTRALRDAGLLPSCAPAEIRVRRVAGLPAVRPPVVIAGQSPLPGPRPRIASARTGQRTRRPV